MLKNPPHILVVCSRNKWRSLTAESLYRNDPRFEIRSAGLSEKANHTISLRDIEWASLILCMEQKHLDKLKRRFPGRRLPKIDVLDIPDEYDYMRPELVEILHEKIEIILQTVNI